MTTLPCYPGTEMKSSVMSATEFKAKCLACLDDIEQHGAQITITRRGKPVAVLGPPKTNGRKSSFNSWARKGKIVGDIIDTSDVLVWNCARD